MSFTTKIFIILSVIVCWIFLLVAGGLVAKQENFKARYARERVERATDRRVQERLEDRLAALKEEKRRLVFQKREEVLILQRAKTLEEQKAEEAVRNEQAVNEHLARFEQITAEFDDIMEAYKNTLEGLIKKAQNLADKKNRLVVEKGQMWEKLAKATSEVARMREHLNVLDYKLYHVTTLNTEKRQLLELYKEIDPTAQTPGFGSPTSAVGRILAVRPDAGGVVIVNVGRNEGVQLHAIFSVTRSGQFVGQIEIFEVWDRRAAGRVLAHMQRHPPLVGDEVRPRMLAGSPAGG